MIVEASSRTIGDLMDFAGARVMRVFHLSTLVRQVAENVEEPTVETFPSIRDAMEIIGEATGALLDLVETVEKSSASNAVVEVFPSLTSALAANDAYAADRIAAAGMTLSRVERREHGQPLGAHAKQTEDDLLDLVEDLSKVSHTLSAAWLGCEALPNEHSNPMRSLLDNALDELKRIGTARRPMKSMAPKRHGVPSLKSARQLPASKVQIMALELLARLSNEMAFLVDVGAMHPIAPPKADPVCEPLSAHCRALAALEAACQSEEADQETVDLLSVAEHEARRRLLPFVPTTLHGVQVKLAYCLAFSLPAWADSDPADEPIELLKSTAEALHQLLG